MKPIFTCFSVCQGVQELLLLGRKENSQGMKFSTQSSRPAMVSFLTPLPCRCLRVLSSWIFSFLDWGVFSWNLGTHFKGIVYFEFPFLGVFGCFWCHGTGPTPWVTHFKGATIKKAKEVMLIFRFFPSYIFAGIFTNPLQSFSNFHLFRAFNTEIFLDLEFC